MPKPIPPKLYLRVAVPSPLRKTFDYLPPPDQPLPLPGSRVSVPFGKQQAVGLVLAVEADTEVAADKLKPALRVLDDTPLFDPPLLKLYRWASAYYMYPVGQALQTSLPRPIREGAALYTPGQRCWRLSEAGAALDPDTLRRAPRQLQLLNLLRSYGELSTPECATLLGQPAAPGLKALLQRGLIIAAQRPLATPPPRGDASREPLPLNPEQAQALSAITTALGTFRCFLLEGITGSGKTEVYLQAIARVLAAGGQVLVLVPEISLTPQTVTRFASRFDCPIVAFHSGLTDRQRCDGWLAARNGSAAIVIGTRSAVFTPLPRLGLIIIDEEHDNSYKQQEGFRYSARNVAVYRASLLHIPIVLGSATPALESLHNALSGRYTLLQLNTRAGNASLPTLRLLDLRLQEVREGFSSLLLQRMREQLAGGHQVLVFLNRRGFAPLLLCRDCGWIAECRRCERSYTLHRQPAALRCHHCDARAPLPRACPDCGGAHLAGMGLGTERSEALLTTEFPDYPVLRIDRDTTRGSGSLEHYLQQVNSGIPCILVGTQMLAKGHHFPRVTLVAILDADSGLFSADFRGQETLGQLLTQVAGRAGRAQEPGQVWIQSYHPQHPALQQLTDEGYGAFARALLEQRRQGNLPPFSHCLLLQAEARQPAQSLQFLQQALHLVQQEPAPGLECFGPMQSPLGKRAGYFRAQLILQATRRQTLQRLGPRLLAQLAALPLARKVRWSADVDPVDFS